MCNNWPDFPTSIWGATGGLIGDTVIICGGDDGDSFIDECYSFTSEKATLVTHMYLARSDAAASIVINDNTLWITGGWHYPPGHLASTEYVTVTGTTHGPDLPMALTYHAMVAINSTCSMVIGGHSYLDYSYPDGYSASTFFYDHNEEEWINGPSLIQARSDHAAGIVTDEVTGEHFITVTGGYDFGYLDSTEILQDGEWVQGKINAMLSFGYF